MERSTKPLVLNKIPVTPWVRGTAEKMQKAGSESRADWRQFWLKTYQGLGGCSDDSGSKGCPRVAAYGLWFLGRLRDGGRPLKSWTVVKIKRQLGKNAAYATIAADLLEQGESPAMDSLWPGVRDRYKKHTGEEAAEYEQGQIKLVAALFREHQLRTQPGRA